MNSLLSLIVTLCLVFTQVNAVDFYDFDLFEDSQNFEQDIDSFIELFDDDDSMELLLNDFSLKSIGSAIGNAVDKGTKWLAKNGDAISNTLGKVADIAGTVGKVAGTVSSVAGKVASVVPIPQVKAAAGAIAAGAKAVQGVSKVVEKGAQIGQKVVGAATTASKAYQDIKNGKTPSLGNSNSSGSSKSTVKSRSKKSKK
ncbi:hypothetical protein EDI_352650 [Entamoeba dispar SAW760]|uniref:Uncharacterized protein n=1 Tax=Entamoeba dispar (strain ATCC PRA-260 / SAW760) TaxID=370354 RepID=B0EBF4_ENTDS|nr:uncharacterized protein EDI_352650 [Entamoeba dispar SAW760]EDR28148.1 hypothetical protein EDI_352650 [Entamoeba dispar SAW760]|eukprot:EDR28148.1 hypothetical protein EDI_352650 [Entamoeba dispar SAW760]